MTRKKNIQQRTEDALEQIRNDELSEEDAARIAARVRQRLESHAGAAEAAEVGTIRGCQDYQALIPAFVAGSLAPSRALLLDEHTRHCVPCRRALKAMRDGDSGATETRGRELSARTGGLGRWLAAAALVAIAAGTGFFVWNAGPELPYGARIESAGAGLYRVDSLERLEVGAEIAVGDEIRSAPGASSILLLADGSRVEVKGRSELAVESARRGTTVRVDRGSVIVEAAPQGRGRLFVSTDDCLVSVKGTIFAVSHGTRGSRVAVIEGEVQVDYAGAERVLSAGDRTATYADVAGFALHEELAWSQGVDRYLALLREVTELRQALERELPRPGLRYSSRLLELAPDDMVFYAAFPNLVETLVEAERIVQERIGESEVLREWYEQRQGSGFDAHMEWTSMLSEAGGYLGDEIVVTGTIDGAGEMRGPVILAELVDPRAMRAWLEQAAEEDGDLPSLVFVEGSEPVLGNYDALFIWIGDDTLIASPRAGEMRGPVILAELVDPRAMRAWLEQAAEEDGDLPSLVFVEGSEPVLGNDDALFIWIGDDTLIASPRADLVRETLARRGVGAAGASGLKAQVAEVYRNGAETLVAVDAREITATVHRSESAEDAARAEQLGIFDASHLIFQQKRFENRTDNSAVLAFDGERSGLAGWLAEPAPMGSLAYVSPDAKLVASAILVDPALIAEQIIALSTGADGTSGLADLEAELGLSLQDDFAAALGGEVTLALDGPVVPEPAWKIVAEVYDPDKLVWAIGQVLEAINRERAADGREPMSWVEERAGGRTYYGFDGEMPVRFTFDEGYLVAATNRGLIERALRYRQSGYSIESSSRFNQLMPADGRENFSAFLYQDALELLGPLAERIAQGELTAEQQAAIESLRGQTEPTLAYAYAEASRIVFAASGAMDLLSSGLPGMLGLGGLCLDDVHPSPGQRTSDDETPAGQEA